MTPTTTQELAREALRSFETATRSDGESYVRLRDDRPDWVQDMVYEAHENMLPDDWRYATIQSALDCIADSDDPQDAVGEWADSRMDHYHSGLSAWLTSHAFRPAYCDEAQSEGLVAADAGIFERIRVGQYVEASEVYGLVLAYLESCADD